MKTNPNEPIKRKCFNHRKEVALKLHGFEVCSATHPMKPNYSGNSRGRKMHLAKNDTHTICNMLIDEYCPASDTAYTIIRNGKCGNCFNPNAIKKAKLITALNQTQQ